MRKKRNEIKELLEYLKRFDIKSLLLTPTENGLLQFMRYALVGSVATLVDWGVLFLLTQFGMYYIISAVIAFFAGLFSNFILSKLFVFKLSEARVGKAVEFIGYAVIGAMGLLFTVVIMYFFTDIIGLYYMLSKVIATVLVLFWNYVARKKLLYKNQ